MKVIVGTRNKAKIEAVERVFNRYFEQVELHSQPTPSRVSEQPIGNDETRQGAVNRSLEALSCDGDVIGVGLEGGVMYVGNTMYVCNWGALALKDGTILTAAGAQIPLPENIRREIESGRELGPLVESLFQQQGIRQGEGAMGIFTSGVVTRMKLFDHIMELLIGQYIYLQKGLNE